MSYIGYHTRLYGNNSHKVCGGSFGGAINTETVNRLVNAFFSVVVKNSGTPVFVDREGREVTLYLSVDAGCSDQGVQALKAWREERAKQEADEENRREQEQAEIDLLMEGLSHEDIVLRLRSAP